jgi:hypothetical protein
VTVARRRTEAILTPSLFRLCIGTEWCVYRVEERGALLGIGHKDTVADVSCIDSAGFAYLIGSLASVRKRRGDLKLLNPPDDVRAVMELSKLLTVFDVGEDEASVVKSFANCPNGIA